MLAHVLLLPGAPAWAGWVVAAVEVGVFAVLVFGERTQRRIALAVGALALGALILVGVLVRTAPPAPPISLTLGAPPPRTTTPVVVLVCPSEAGALDGGRMLSLSVDGAQKQLLTSLAEIAVPLQPGHHVLKVELLSADHVAFNPRITVQEAVDVTGPAPPDASASYACPT